MLMERRARPFLVGVFDRVVGMGDVLLRLLLMRALVMGDLIVQRGRLFGLRGHGCLDDRRYRRFGVQRLGRSVIMIVVAMIMRVVVRVVFMRVVSVFMSMLLVMLLALGMGMFIVMMFPGLMLMVRRFGVIFAIMRMLVIRKRGGLGRLRVLDDLALDAVAAAAAARTAMARTAAVVAVLVFFLGFAVGALVRLDQGLTVGDGDLIVVGMNFAEGEEAVAIAAIFDEGRLQRRFYARDLGEIDIAAQLLALCGFKIKFFDAIAADHDDPGLFRVGGIDQHLVGHFGTLGGGGRVGP
jgi:hypothetical protein